MFQSIDYAQYTGEGGRNTWAENQLLELSDAGSIDATAILARLYTQSTKPEEQQRAEQYFAQLENEDNHHALSYLQWLVDVSQTHPIYIQLTHNMLWLRQNKYNDAQVLLLQFYGLHTEYYDIGDLESFYNKWKSSYVEQDIDNAFKYLNIFPEPIRYHEDINELCTSYEARENVSHRATCYQLKLKMAKQQNNVKVIDELIVELKQDYKNRLVTEDGITRCARTLIDDTYGRTFIRRGLQLSSIDPSSDKLFLFTARYEIKQQIVWSDDKLVEGLNQRSATGNSNATLLLGLLYLKSDRTPDDPQLAEKYLRQVQNDDRGAYYLGLLYLSGKLGEEKLQQGVDFLLYSARSGFGQSYTELAKAFYDSPGIKPNYDYAWVFSKMAIDFALFNHAKEQSELTDWLRDLDLKRERMLSERLLDEENALARWGIISI